METKRIIIVGPSHPFRGGIAAFTDRLATALQNEGHDVSIVTFTLQYPSFLFPGKTQFSDAEAPDLEISRKLNSINPFNWLKVGRYLKKQKADLIIPTFWLPFMGPALGTICRIARSKHTKVVAILHNMLPHEKRPGDKLLSNYFVKSCDAFVCLAKSVLNDLALFDKHKPKTYTPHPIYDQYGDLLPKKKAAELIQVDPGTNYLLFFGFIRAYKGLDLLMEAFADKRFRDKNIKLIVAGEFYEEEQKYLDLIQQLELKEEIILKTEFIAENEVNRYFSVADIVVQPYKSATQSGVAQIAYHFEKPILVTDVGGLKEIIPDKKVGYVTEVDATAIADKLLDFYEHKRASEFAPYIAEEKKKYQWNKMTSTLFEQFAKTQ